MIEPCDLSLVDGWSLACDWSDKIRVWYRATKKLPELRSYQPACCMLPSPFQQLPAKLCEIKVASKLEAHRCSVTRIARFASPFRSLQHRRLAVPHRQGTGIIQVDRMLTWDPPGNQVRARAHGGGLNTPPWSSADSTSGTPLNCQTVWSLLRTQSQGLNSSRSLW